jgi:hypothetical protein
MDTVLTSLRTYPHCMSASRDCQSASACASSEEGQRRSPHLQGRPGGAFAPQKTPSSALSLPCEIVSISQGRPLFAPEFTKSGQEETGKGLKIPSCGGSSLHATPFRQEAAVHLMPMGFPGGAPPPGLPRSAGEGALQASPFAGKPLPSLSCVHSAKLLAFSYPRLM